MRWAIVAAAMAIAVPAFGQIVLDHHEELSVEQARQLVERNEGKKIFLFVTTLPFDVAETVAKHVGELSLDFVTTISVEATEALAKHKGRLSLRGL